MKRALFASAILGAAGMIAPAKADVINTLTHLTIWSADTPGVPGGDPSQLGGPGSTIKTAGDLVANGAAAGSISFDIDGTPGSSSTIGQFLATGTLTTNPCTGTCASTTLSTINFAHVSLFEFTFTAPSNGTLTTQSDDGDSLFVAGTEPASCTTASCPGDLFAPN